LAAVGAHVQGPGFNKVLISSPPVAVVAESAEIACGSAVTARTG